MSLELKKPYGEKVNRLQENLNKPSQRRDLTLDNYELYDWEATQTSTILEMEWLDGKSMVKAEVVTWIRNPEHF